MGETQDRPFQLSFNSWLKVDFQGARVTSDGGLLLVRELDERLGFGQLIERHLSDGRGMNTQLLLTDLVRQSVYSRLAGYEDVNDAERLSQDPAFRLMGSSKIWERGGALTSRLQSFETEVLTQEKNLAGLAALNRELVGRAEAIDSGRRVVLDMDSTEIPIYGEQEQSAYNGHFEVHGARSAMRTIERRRTARSVWASRLKLRRGSNVAAVALANKNARVLWALLTRGESYRPTPFSTRIPQAG